MSKNKREILVGMCMIASCAIAVAAGWQWWGAGSRILGSGSAIMGLIPMVVMLTDRA